MVAASELGKHSGVPQREAEAGPRERRCDRILRPEQQADHAAGATRLPRRHRRRGALPEESRIPALTSTRAAIPEVTPCNSYIGDANAGTACRTVQSVENGAS